MSTEFKSRSRHYFLTQYSGPITGNGGDCRRMQVTGASSFRAPYFTLGKADVAEFVAELSTKVNAMVDEEETVNVHGIELMQVSAKRLCLDLNDWYNDALTEHNY